MVVPEPLLITPPVPASAALTVPPASANVPDENSVPFCSVPLDRVKPPFCVCVVAPRSRVPPATVVEPVVAPSVPLPASSRMPAFTRVLPV